MVNKNIKEELVMKKWNMDLLNEIGNFSENREDIKERQKRERRVIFEEVSVEVEPYEKELTELKNYNKNRSDEEYDFNELKMGIEVEMEHTNIPAIAKCIAKDHLDEIPDYYTRLKKMEDEGKKALNKNESSGDFFTNIEGIEYPFKNRDQFINVLEKLAQDDTDAMQRILDIVKKKMKK
jgi:hypothetical protein